MVFVWRGIGIIVPILFFIVGCIVGIFIDDQRLGNPRFIGWTSFYSAILLTLIGLAVFGGTKEEGADENQPKKKHDFFFIPVLFWGLILGALSAYLLIFAGKPDDKASDKSDSVPVVKEQKVYRKINIFNAGDDTLKYVVADEKGLIERDYLNPMTFDPIELVESNYLFSAFDPEGNATISLPDEKYANDKSKYVVMKDDKGSFYLRSVHAPTPDSSDYDEGWLLINGTDNMAVVNITEACAAGMTAEKIKAVDWMTKVDKMHDGHDLIELNLKAANKNGKLIVLKPGEKVPGQVGPNDTVYMLSLVDREIELDKDILASRILGRLGMDE